ncbi:MAG: [FeFe] hydrogenase H-cluster radical SAM maturase HydE [Candidatus Omnitrophota bacterium]
MQNSKLILKLLKRIYESKTPCLDEIKQLLSVNDEADKKIIFDFADQVRAQYMGQGVLIRGIVEFSNFCQNPCFYCGLNKGNSTLERYRMTQVEILESVYKIASLGIKTVVLQSGDDNFKAVWLKEIIQEIKQKFDIAVTLSAGERKPDDYKIWRQAGADRYLLKIETTDKRLYEILHPGMSFENRLKCLEVLKGLNYQTGSGNIIGLRNQTIESIASDIIFLKQKEFDMISISPFIPHQKTKLAGQPKGKIDLTLIALALTRILTKNTQMPATTALSAGKHDYRVNALSSGANVLMFNFTPLKYRLLYDIYPVRERMPSNRVYPNEKPLTEDVDSEINNIEKQAKIIGRILDYSERGIYV